MTTSTTTAPAPPSALLNQSESLTGQHRRILFFAWGGWFTGFASLMLLSFLLEPVKRAFGPTEAAARLAHRRGYRHERRRRIRVRLAGRRAGPKDIDRDRDRHLRRRQPALRAGQQFRVLLRRSRSDRTRNRRQLGRRSGVGRGDVSTAPAGSLFGLCPERSPVWAGLRGDSRKLSPSRSWGGAACSRSAFSRCCSWRSSEWCRSPTSGSDTVAPWAGDDRRRFPRARYRVDVRALFPPHRVQHVELLLHDHLAAALPAGRARAVDRSLGLGDVGLRGGSAARVSRLRLRRGPAGTTLGVHRLQRCSPLSVC